MAATRTEQFRIRGMDCADCARSIELAIQELPGIWSADVNFGAAILRLRYSPTQLKRSDITEKINSLGYSLSSAKEGETFWQRRGRQLATFLSGLSVLIGAVVDIFSQSAALPIPFFLSAVLIGGFYPARNAWASLRHLRFDMNVLMSIAVLGAMSIGEWFEAGTVIFLFMLAQLLESMSMGRAREAIRALMDLSPDMAVVQRNGQEESMPVEMVPIGEIVIVQPGEKIPLDGIVASGSSEVNQAQITGESVPVPKGEGDFVFAGTVNGQGVLEVETTKHAEETTLAHIIHVVQEAQAQKAPAERFVDTFSRYYTPAVLLFAVLIALVPPILGSAFLPWFYRALVMLVIACPCALVISTPVSIMSGLAAAARAGVLMKGGVFLEQFSRVETIVFDKTGTLTSGQPEVTDVLALDTFDEQELLAMAAAVEMRSEHHLAQAIVREAKRRQLSIPNQEGQRSLIGQGATALIEGERYFVGNHRLFDEKGTCAPEIEEKVARLERQGKTAVLVGDEQRVIGAIAVADALRPDALSALRSIRRLGVQNTVLLTGDNAETARAIGKTLEFEECYSELLPGAKADVVRRLANGAGRVIMVGDGVNDAPALAAADIGVAMGAGGTDVALETADVALMADELNGIPFSIVLSRRTRRTIGMNISAALAIKALVLGLAAAGLATLWMAIAADMGASLLVVLNGLRLLGIKKEPVHTDSEEENR